MLSRLRDSVQPLRRFLAWPFLRAGASPAFVGGFGVALAALAALLARYDQSVPAFWLALLALGTDLADGEVARQTGRCSPEGNYLDAMGDRTRECLLLLGLVPFAPSLAALALAGACLASFAKARCALVRQMDNRDWPALGDYPDRGVLILVAYVSLPNPSLALSALAAVSWSCLWQRVRHARRLIAEASPEELQPYLRGSAPYQR